MVLKKKEKRNYWKAEEEELLKQWGDKSQCYQWMHRKARESYQTKNALYTIPVIVISTITGTANFAQDRFSDNAKPYVAMIIGTMSIIAGIITTVSQFLKVSELNESHRIASLSWGKFYRDINAELIRHPLDRIPADEFIKKCKEEYNRLVEISPFVPNKILRNFNTKFKNNDDLIKPEIGDVINATDIYLMDKIERKNMVENLNKEITMQNKEIAQKIGNKQTRKEQFSTSFYDLNRRYPTEAEFKKNIKYIEDDTNYIIDIEKSKNKRIKRSNIDKISDNISNDANDYISDNISSDVVNECKSSQIDIGIDTDEPDETDDSSFDLDDESNIKINMVTKNSNIISDINDSLC